MASNSRLATARLTVSAICLGLSACGGGGGSAPVASPPAWSPPSRVTATSGSSYALTVLEGTDNGSAIALMTLTGVGALAAMQFDVASGWSGLRTLAPKGGNSRLAVATDGSAIAVWIQPKADCAFHDEAWTSRFTPGRGWDAPFRLDGSSAGTSFEPRVAIDTKAQAHVAWHRIDGPCPPDVRSQTGTKTLLTRRRLGAAAWSAVQTLEPDTSVNGPIAEFLLAAGGDGHALLGWQSSNNKLVSRRYTSASWQPPSTVDDLTGSANLRMTGFGPLTVDSRGVATLLWRRERTDPGAPVTEQRVMANRSSTGGTWTRSTALSNANAMASIIGAGLQKDDTVVVAWSQDVGQQLWLTSQSPSGGWAAASKAATGLSGSSRYAIDPRASTLLIAQDNAIWAADLSNSVVTRVSPVAAGRTSLVGGAAQLAVLNGQHTVTVWPETKPEGGQELWFSSR